MRDRGVSCKRQPRLSWHHHGRVDWCCIFFVISGFLISSLILTEIHAGTFRFFNFYARRIRRIFPSLILVAGASLAFGWFALSQSEYTELGKLTVASAAFIANFALWDASGYFNIAAEFKPLLHLWSLGIEEQFYIIWPVLLALFWKRGIRIETAIFTLALLSFALNIFLMHRNPVAAFFFPLSRFWELLLGALLAHQNLSATHSAATRETENGAFDKHVLLRNTISKSIGWACTTLTDSMQAIRAGREKARVFMVSLCTKARRYQEKQATAGWPATLREGRSVAAGELVADDARLPVE